MRKEAEGSRRNGKNRERGREGGWCIKGCRGNGELGSRRGSRVSRQRREIRALMDRDCRGWGCDGQRGCFNVSGINKPKMGAQLMGRGGPAHGRRGPAGLGPACLQSTLGGDPCLHSPRGSLEAFCPSDSHTEKRPVYGWIIWSLDPIPGSTGIGSGWESITNIPSGSIRNVETLIHLKGAPLDCEVQLKYLGKTANSQNWRPNSNPGNPGGVKSQCY